MKSKRIFLSPPHMGGEEIMYVQQAFDTNWIAPMGPNVDGFEKEICEYTGGHHALALSSATAGIHLALKYFGVGSGDYVFCSTFTFSGSCNPILYQNAIPVFIDSEPGSWNMSPIALKKAFEWAKKQNKMPKAVIIVDLYGQSADYDKLLPICEFYKVPVIEDAAEALGAAYKGTQCGNFGDIGVFSFNGNKIITTSGGGMLMSDDEVAIKKMKFWSTQARENEKHYEHIEYGYNYRMSNVVAGIGRGQLKVLDERIKAKKMVTKRYMEELVDLPIDFMPIFPESIPNYWLTVFTIQDGVELTPGEIVDELEKHNIESRPVWKPMHMQPVFKQCKYFPHEEDVSQDLFKRGICLPSGSSITKEEQRRVTDIIKWSFEKSLVYKQTV